MGILYKKADSAQKFQSGGWWDSAVNKAKGFAADNLGQDQWASNSDTQVKGAIAKAKADKEKFASEEKNKKWGNSQSGGWNKNFTDEEVRAKQKELGIKVDGKWGKDSVAAYNKKKSGDGKEATVNVESKPQEAGFFSSVFKGKELTDEEKLKESNIASIKENQKTAPDFYGIVPAKYRMFAKNIISPSSDVDSSSFTASELATLGDVANNKKKIGYEDYDENSVSGDVTKTGLGKGEKAGWRRIIGQGAVNENEGVRTVDDSYDFNTNKDLDITDAQLKGERDAGGFTNLSAAIRDSKASYDSSEGFGQNLYNIARNGIAPHYASVEYKKDLKGTLSSDGRNKMNIQVPKYDSSGKVVYKAGGILYKK